jgi:ribonuclease D
MVANSSDINKLAAFGEKADIDALKGWRREIFGQDALALLEGKLALRLDGDDVVAEPVGDS